MKVVRPTLKILLNDLDKIRNAAASLEHASNEWIERLEYRDNGYGGDQYWISVKRDELEKEIVKFRKQLAEVYDFMGDKGLM